MRAYRNLLKHLSEDAPGTLGRLPAEFITAQARRLVDQDEIYVLEQLHKHVPVMASLPQDVVARATERALERGVVDDFCFLAKHLPPARRPGADLIGRACTRLARRGNAGGIEQIIAATGVRPELDEATALRAYDVLVAAGRLGAVDYVRQLTRVPVRFRPDAVATGMRTLLASGRYGALRKLATLTDVEVRLGEEEVRRAVEEAVVDGTLPELARALDSLRSPPRVEGFAEVFQRLAAEDRLAELPALFKVFADADWDVLDTGMWRRLISSGHAPAVRFAYEHCVDTALLARESRTAYTVGVSSGDRALVRLACERGGARLRVEDAGKLLGDALENGDAGWFDFAAGRLPALPVVDDDRAQLYLALQAVRAPGRVDRDADLLGVDRDAETGQWLLSLAEGRWPGGPCAVEHPLTAPCAVGHPGIDAVTGRSVASPVPDLVVGA
ncbi:hypothetical protein [Streptomyces sp. N35]|uniref:hypothetical protein n=1 Tax=Streptomyces sp. N35 TaxID=2795730 RepID=UPI0018F744AA|nr:hypothetical protein [Streptomyces sp. N35]